MSIETVTVTAAPSCVSAVASVADRAESELLEGLMRGSDKAWREFHLRYDRLIYRCITKVTGRFSAIVSQDDIREIYATLIVQLLSNDMHKLRTFDAARGNRFSSWLGLLAINAAYDYLRGIRREPNRAPLAEAEDLRCDQPTPHELCERRQRAERVVSALKHFSDKDKQFVELYFGEGMEPEQIAEVMNISVKTVYSKKHKIQSRLESLLSNAA
ncbi:MAG: sigma-70 family RNA polymerase sigma factor [Polyangiaceae bacterium]|jgi:RNA polymerase sigma-70 factor (ECF subfamily)|nr:sigma-70 family RNA polymerase sigma factor [Polyangiaceae bacterium]